MKKAIKIVNQILKLSTIPTDEEIEESLSDISKAQSTYGVLWGAGNISAASRNLEFGTLQEQVLRMIGSLRKEKIYSVCRLIRDDLVSLEKKEGAKDGVGSD